MGGRAKSGAAALGGARDHLSGEGGDNQQGGGAAANDEGGDKAGEIDRREFKLSEDQRENLTRIRNTPWSGDAVVDDREERFWTQIAPPMGFNPVTVQPAEDVLETGVFTAWPHDPAPEPERDFNPATNEADHEAAIARIHAIAESVKFDDTSRIGRTLTDTMLDILRNRHKPWPAMTEIEKRDVATAIDYAIKVELRSIVNAIASQGRPSIPATLEKYADKGGEITATLKIAAAADATVLALHRASGKLVMIVTADADGLMGDEIEIPDDQGGLPFQAGNDIVEEEAGEEDDEAEEGAGGDNGDHGDRSGSEGSSAAETA